MARRIVATLSSPAGALAVRRPRLATRIVGAATGTLALAGTVSAYGVVKATRLVQQLELAAKELPDTLLAGGGAAGGGGGGGAHQHFGGGDSEMMSK